MTYHRSLSLNGNWHNEKLLFMNATEPILVLTEVPPTLELCLEDLRDFGFKTQSISTKSEIDSYAGTPLLAVVPLSNTNTLDQIQIPLVLAKKKWPELGVVAIYAGRLPFSIGDLYKLGVNHVFQIPLELDPFLNKCFEICPVDLADANLTFQMLVRVNVGKLRDAAVSPFDLYLYLPSNRKIIRYVSKDRPVEKKSIDKFEKQKNFSLYMKRSDLKLYSDTQAKVLSELVTANRSEFGGELARLMGGFFDDTTFTEEDGQQLLGNFKSVMSKLNKRIGGASAESDIQKFASQMFSHSGHSQNVGAYCCLFGSVLGNFNPQDLMLVGLLHDVGVFSLPPELYEKPEKDRTPEDKEAYKKHPELALQALENQKMALSSAVKDGILYHHERPDGSGYPLGKKAQDIPDIAKICAFADEFDKLTSVRPGFPTMTPQQALQKLTSSPLFEPAFHGAIAKIFEPPPAPKTEGKVEVKTPKQKLDPSQFITLRDYLLKHPEAKVFPSDKPSEDPVEKQLQDHFNSLQKNEVKAGP